MTRRTAVRGIVLHNGKLLCVRLKPYNPRILTTTEHWCLPGGGLDDGETLTDGIRREMLEETGVEPQIGELLYVHQFGTSDRDHLEFFFHITNSGDYLDIDLSKSSHGTIEIAEIDFIDPATVDVRPVFLATEDLARKIITPSPATLFSFL